MVRSAPRPRQDSHFEWSDKTEDNFNNWAKNCTGREHEPECAPEEKAQQWSAAHPRPRTGRLRHEFQPKIHGFSTLFYTSEGSPAPKALQEGGRPAPQGGLLCSRVGLRMDIFVSVKWLFWASDALKQTSDHLRPPRRFAIPRPDTSKPPSVFGW